MRISRIQIKNFRNFRNLNLILGDNVVILGENKVGKTNLLFALRLVLDPSLPDSARRLRLEDFWDGLGGRPGPDDLIEISVEFRGFDGNVELLAVLADCLVRPVPMVARVTYRFQPIAGLSHAPRSESDYEFLVFGGRRPENTVGYDVRRWMPMDVFAALRDAESDLARWNRSPLRPLLDRAAANIDPDDLAQIAQGVHAATVEMTTLPDLIQVVDEVNAQLSSMVGTGQAIETSLGFAPTEANRLLRSLQLMIDGDKRGVAEASLGSANVLYLALKSLELNYLISEGVRQHTFLAIEEPEAHLHPHVQRILYRNYLRGRDGSGASVRARTVLLTTHSPNVASVAPLDTIVVLRTVDNETIGRSLKKASKQLTSEDRDDLERYLDVTRGELFFARAVLLVEGDAEKFLVPALAAKHMPAIDLDALGITVCSIGGTNFGPYIKLLGAEGLDIPFAVLTDFDPKGKAGSQEDDDPTAVEASYGEQRVVYSIMRWSMNFDDWDYASFEQILEKAPDYGVFLNDYTFEIDLFRAGAAALFHLAAQGLSKNKALIARFAALQADTESLNPKQFLKDIETIGKGRMAQRLASLVAQTHEPVTPPYIEAAFDYLLGRLGE